MLSNVVLGSNDMVKSCAFYDAVLATIGMRRVMELAPAVIYGVDAPAIIVRPPLNGDPATFANGGTVGLAAPSRAAVDAWHDAALAHGGSCEGPPGPRALAGGLYGAYVRDPLGNKLSCYAYAAR